jgi:hypothetical protein
MNWDRSETIGLAKQFCKTCDGGGLKPKTKGRPTPCNCVLRAIFRACYARFRRCATKEKFMSKVSMIPCAGKENKMTFARLDEEYVADFCLISRRSLEPFDYEIFRNHFLLGADWRLCCRQMKCERGDFFHSVYRIQQRLGRVFRELEPYGLFPVDEYFAGRIDRTKVVMMPERTKARPVSPPVRKSA